MDATVLINTAHLTEASQGSVPGVAGAEARDVRILLKLVIELPPFEFVLCEPCSYHGWYALVRIVPTNHRGFCVPMLVAGDIRF